MVAEGQICQLHALEDGDGGRVRAVERRALNHHDLAAVPQKLGDELRVALVVQLSAQLGKDTQAWALPRALRRQLVCSRDRRPDEVG